MGNSKGKGQPENSYQNLNKVLNGSKHEQRNRKREERLSAIEKRSNQWEKRLEKNRIRKESNLEIKKKTETSSPSTNAATEIIPQHINNQAKGTYEDMVACRKILQEAITKCELSELQLAVAKAKSINFIPEQEVQISPEMEQAQRMITMLEVSQVAPEITKFKNELQKLKTVLERDSIGQEAFNVVLKLLNNLVNSPFEDKYKKINLDNSIIKSKVMQHHGSETVSFFTSIGFVKKTESSLVLQSSTLFEKGKSEIIEELKNIGIS